MLGSNIHNQKGITLIELLVVIGVFSVLAGIAFVNLTTPLNKAYTSSSFDSLLADIKAQQLKSMASASSGQKHGIYFGSNFYTTFVGTAYTPSNTTNKITNLSLGITFTSITIPTNSLIFDAITGEVTGFSGSTYQFAIHNSNTNESRVVTINRYGALALQ